MCAELVTARSSSPVAASTRRTTASACAPPLHCPLAVNASKPPGEWQTFDVVFRAPRFDGAGKKIENAKFIKVVHNGQVIHENVEVKHPTGAAWVNKEMAKGPLLA